MKAHNLTPKARTHDFCCSISVSKLEPEHADAAVVVVEGEEEQEDAVSVSPVCLSYSTQRAT